MDTPTSVDRSIGKENLVELYVQEVTKNLALKREKCKADLFLFNKFILNAQRGQNKIPLAHFHRQLCDFVQNRRDKKKLILIPRGHLKSTLVTIGYSLFRIVENQNVRILILNATWQMAVDFLTEIKNHLTKNEMLREVFGDLYTGATEWAQDRITLNRSDQGRKGPTVWAAGVETNLIGAHPDMIILDDVVNRDTADSDEAMHKVIMRYRDALDLLEPGGQLIVIGTRWNDKDLYEWILNPENKIVQSYDVMVKPAFETDFPFSEVFTKDGEGLIRNHLWPEKFNFKELWDRYREKGPYEFCTPAETPILMADWTIKSIGEINAGDMVVGWDQGTPKNRSKLRPVKVIKKSSTIGVVNDLVMKSGRKVRCTQGHRWYSGKLDKSHHLYKPARVGSKLMYVCPTEINYLLNDLPVWFYLAGIFDGEGSAKSGGCLTITQSTKNEVVLQKIRDVLKYLHIEFSEFFRSGNRLGWSDSIVLWMKDNFETSLRFIRITGLAKKQQLVDKLYKHGKRFVREEDVVLEIRQGKEEEVFALETETGNYVAWGYASSNSAQYLNDPVPNEEADFRRDWFKYIELSDWHGRIVNRYMTIDPAISLKKEADFTSVVITDVDGLGYTLVRHIENVKVMPNQLIELIFRLAENFHPNTIGIEVVAFQKVLQYALNEEMRRRGRRLPIMELQIQDRSKDERIRALQPLYANGKILHSKEIKNTDLLEEQLLRFPRGKHDDVIDALASTLELIVPPKLKTDEDSRSRHHYLYGYHQ